MDYSSDEDHNRSVITVAGEPEALKIAAINAIGKAVELIDMTQHQGQHPRMGAVDVVPFIPIKNVTMEETVALSKEVAETVAQRYGLPSYLYERSASASHRENLAAVRRGEFEGLTKKMKSPDWKPDFGHRGHIHGRSCCHWRPRSAGGICEPGTDNLEIAKAIARKVRFIGGGLRSAKRWA